ncbi:methyltransferase domain-containing protein [Candidatus Micrarchaeota archaeon]|nr:methyltransferase domain-containing protein [Candidatus Micrarchaeota archaeon]
MISKDDFHLPPFARKLKRGGPATTHPKDAGLVLGYTGITKESRVLELGCGSGYMTVQFASIAKEVVSYEKREEFLVLAKENVQKNHLDNVTFNHKDVHEGISETPDSFDLVFVDIADAERIVPVAHSLLKKGGYLVGHCLQMDQARKLQLELQKQFSESFSLESSIREFEAREFGFRPQHFGLTYTAIMVFGRK